MTTHTTKLTAEVCRKIIIICCGHAYTAFPTEFYDSQLCGCHLIKPEDPRIKSGFITYDSPKGGGTIKGLLSQPTAPKESTM
jgi:hypothetical protein